MRVGKKITVEDSDWAFGGDVPEKFVDHAKQSIPFYEKYHDIKSAYHFFTWTEMDYLVLENVLLDKKDQKKWKQDESWKNEFELD